MVHRTNEETSYIHIHPSKNGRIPVGKHSSEEVRTGTLYGILKLAGLK